MKRTHNLFILLFLTTFQLILSAQVKITPLSKSGSTTIDSVLFGSSSTRVLKILNSGWRAYIDPYEKKIATTLPAKFEGSEFLFFEKEINFTEDEIKNYIFLLGLLGSYYSTEIFINDYNIHKSSSGDLPYEIEIPKDLLAAGKTNLLKIKVSSRLDSRTTIPVKQKFLFPLQRAGIIQDVYLKYVPKTNIKQVSLNYRVAENLTLASCVLNYKLEFQKKGSEPEEKYTFDIFLFPKNKAGKTFSYSIPLLPTNSEEVTGEYQFTIDNFLLWSIENPEQYNLKVTLSSEGKIFDSISKEVAFTKFEFKNSQLRINNLPIQLKGTTYYFNEFDYSKITLAEKIRQDFNLIKNTGFNAVRFAKANPNPLAIKLCEEVGLIALVELPINSVPEEILADPEFQLIAASRFKEIIKSYSTYSNAIVWGLGSSYLSNSDRTKSFLKKLANDNQEEIITYASFVGIPEIGIEGINLYGIEIYSTPADKLEAELNFRGIENLHNYFLSEVNYPNYFGNGTGYLAGHTSEAQAKFFETYLDFVKNSKIGGIVINSLLTYGGNSKSFYGGFNDKNYYQLGIIGANGKLNTIAYRVIESKLKQKERVTVPIGVGKDENKLIFILIALALSVTMAVLINTKKSFRADCSRALFRSYNFFSDIRDHRILSGFYTYILMLIEVGSISLLFTIVLYYLRTNILLEKLLIAFGNGWILNIVSSLAWNPEKSFLILSSVMLVKILLLAVIIKATSSFIKTRVNFLNILYTIIWALLPLTLLLPIELIFYKILSGGSMNLLILISIALFFFWILNRILKGAFVLLDSQPFKVYFYGFLFFLGVPGLILLYFQLTNLTLYYIINAIEQYKQLLF